MAFFYCLLCVCVCVYVDVDFCFFKKLCINADPNYGAMWFHCKLKPLDNALEVFFYLFILIIFICLKGFCVGLAFFFFFINFFFVFTWLHCAPTSTGRRISCLPRDRLSGDKRPAPVFLVLNWGCCSKLVPQRQH